MLCRLIVLVLAGLLADLPLLASHSMGAAAQETPPPHDDFADAIVVDALPFVDKDRDVSGATWDETTDGSPLGDRLGYACQSVDDPAPVDQTVWYAYTPTEDIRVTVDTFGSTYSTVVAVYTGTRSNLQEVACSRHPYQARVSFDAAAGETYRVMVAAFNVNRGDVFPADLLTVAMRPARQSNDDFDGALAVGDLPFFDVRDTSEATEATDEPLPTNCDPEPGDAPISKTVWYAYTPSADGRVAADTFGSAYNTVVAAYTGDWNSLEQVVCNDDSATTVQSRAEFAVAAGTTYYLQVALWLQGGSGTLAFAVRDASSPDATPPEEPAVTVEESERDQYVDGTTLYYNPTGNGGTFTVTSTTVDDESGVAAVDFPAVFGGDASSDTMPSTVEATTAAVAEPLQATAAFVAPGVLAAQRGLTYEATYTWEAQANADGVKRVKARNGIGQTAIATFTVRSDARAPSVAIAAPKDGVRVSQGQTVKVEASDGGAGVAKVQVRYCRSDSCRPGEGTVIGIDTKAPYAVVWSELPAAGTYTLVAQAVDRVGNTRTSAPVTVKVVRDNS